MKILVTGGAGFIGSHLAEYLVRSGHHVDVIDDLSAGKREYVPKGARFFKSRCQDWMPDEDYDFSYHLASTVGVAKVVADPTHCIRNVVESTSAALRGKGIYFSTSEVYGKNTGLLSEDSEIQLSSKSRWNYAAAKLCGEWMARQAGWKVVRLFNVIGPRQNMAYGAVFPNFVSQAVSGQALTVHGDGSQVRTFIDVRDCVELLDRLRDREFDICNVGGELVLPIVGLARSIREITKSDSEIRFTEYPMGNGFEECVSRIPDLGQLQRLVPGFRYRKLEETVEACQPNLVM